MSDNLKDGCCQKCEEAFQKCINDNPGNPTGQAMCSRHYEQCKKECGC